MANIQFSTLNDVYADDLSDSQSALYSLTGTTALITVGAYVLKLTGAGFTQAGAGTVTGFQVYQSDDPANTTLNTLFAQTTAAISMSLSSVLANVGVAGDTDPFEVLLGGNDTLTGTAGSDRLWGGKGADTLLGGAGDDYLVGDNDDERLGTGYADVLDGGAGNDTLNGGLGADRMTGGTGNDLYNVDDVGDLVIETAGGGSFDRVNVQRYGYTDTGNVVLMSTYTLPANVENLSVQLSYVFEFNGNSNSTPFVGIGNELANRLQASSFLNDSSYNADLSYEGVELRGMGGNDRLVGGAGDDVLDGGTGIDTMIGNLGSDTFIVDSNADVVIESTVGAATRDTDVVRYDVPVAGTVSLGGVVSGLSNLATYASGIEGLQLGALTSTRALNAVGNAGDNLLIGNAAANKLYGLAGNDWLDGKGGIDTMVGGEGDDTYVIDVAADQIVEAAGAAGGNDTVQTALASYSLIGTNLENITLVGTGAQTAIGNSSANVLTAGAGNNTLNGGDGSDTASWAEAESAVNVSLLLSGAQPTGGSGSDTLISIENLTGSAHNDRLVGNAAANVLTGGDGSDLLTGGAGADVFVLNNTSGSDTINDFVHGTDKLRISQASLKIGDGDTVVEGAVTVPGSGGFAKTAEVVVISDPLFSLDSFSVSAKIGSATSAYAKGDQVLFVLHSTSDSAVFLFTSNGADAAVSYTELELLVTTDNTPTLNASDLLFGA